MIDIRGRCQRIKSLNRWRSAIGHPLLRNDAAIMQAAWEMLPHPVGKSRRRAKREIAIRRGGSKIKFHATLKGKRPRNLSV